MEQERALQALSALSHATRLEIVRLLVPCGRSGLQAGAIAKRLGVAASALSFHLGALEQAGIVSSRREGRRVIYSADHRMLGQVIGYLLNDCCRGNAEVCACTQA
jgi:ArsR family transcriptional regulator